MGRFSVSEELVSVHTGGFGFYCFFEVQKTTQKNVVFSPEPAVFSGFSLKF